MTHEDMAVDLNEQSHVGFSGWSVADSKTASSEGWNVWDVDGSDYGRFQICMNDEDGVFYDDEDVWKHVWLKAHQGSKLHERALFFVRQHNPMEYERILGRAFVERWAEADPQYRP